MSVIVSNGANNLSTASAFVKAEVYNTGCFSTTDLVLSTERTIAVTFPTGSRNNAGVILGLSPSGSTAVNRSVTVKLQKNVLGTWTDVTIANGFAVDAYQTLSTSQIMNSVTVTVGDVLMPFTWSGMTIDTSSNTWRFHIVQSGGTTGNWNLKTSNGTAPFYIEISDIAATATDNDLLVLKDQITLDSDFTAKGVVGTGESVFAPAIIICRSSSAITTTSLNENLIWGTGGGYTLTVNGCILVALHSGFRAGTSASRISLANQGTLEFVSPSVGTQSGWITTEGNNSADNGKRFSIFVYGERPAVERTTIVGAVANGATSFTTADSTGWVNGDTITIGRKSAKGLDLTIYTVDSTSGTTVNLTGGIVGDRLDGAAVNLHGKRGFRMLGPSSGTMPRYSWRYPSNFVLDGVSIRYFDTGNALGRSNGSVSQEDAANRSKWTVTHCDIINTAGSSTSYLFQVVNISEEGLEVSYNNFHGCGWSTAPTPYAAGLSGVWNFEYNNILNSSSQALVTCSKGIFDNNKFENSTAVAANLTGVGVTWTNNSIWSNSRNAAGFGAIIIQGSADPIWRDNSYENCTAAFFFSGGYTTVRCVASDDTFGNIVDNTTDINFTGDELIDFQFKSPLGDLEINLTNLLLVSDGSHLRISDYNGTANDDRGYLPYGQFQRCGDGLADTVVHTSGTGKFSLRFQPTNASNLLKWQQKVPTGDIQGMTMSISVWVKMNSANYYSGSYIKPTLRVNYDDGTEVTDVADSSTDWQQLSVSFSPTTAFGQVVVGVEGATDAATTDAYFYVDDFNISYPSGAQMDLGGLDVWVDALPMMPTIALSPSATSVKDLNFSKFVKIKTQ